MDNRDILAIGTSAGGVEALLCLAKAFPPSFPASIVVTIHLPMQFDSVLDSILSWTGPLPAAFANNGQSINKGRIYIAPPGSHLLVEGDNLSLGIGPRENNARPAIDPMLRSAAACCGHRAIGVVLTGTLSDGASGLWALNQCGGVTVVQDPRDAAFPEMPLSALNRVEADHVVRLRDMPALLESLVHQPAGEPAAVPARIKYEVEVARGGRSSMNDLDQIGRRSVLSCPDCGRVTWELEQKGLVRYRCHVGHAYTAELMNLAVDESLRRALTMARRALDERFALTKKLQKDAVREGRAALAESWASRGREFEHEATVIANAIERLDRIASDARAK